MSRSLPAHINLERLRKEAKKLLREYRAGSPEAIALFRGVLKEGSDKPRLADAQFLIARRQGFDSWAELKRHIGLIGADFAKRAEAMITAACSGRLKEARELLNAEPDLATANIFAAVTTGEYAYVEKLVAQDPSIATAVGRDGVPPIIYACYSRFLMDPERANGVVLSVECLLKHAADPNSYFLEKGDAKAPQTALYGASGVVRNPALTKLLLDHGADPDDGVPEPGMGESVYHACESYDLSCLKLLLEAKPRPYTVSYCLAHKLDMEDIDGVRLFLEHGADPNLLFEHGNKGTRLHFAILRRRGAEIIRLLMTNGADWRIPDGDGLSSFAFAVRIGHQPGIDVIREFGATDDDLTVVDNLLGALSQGSGDSVQTILAANPSIVASLSAKDRSVLPEAAKAENTAAVTLMLEAGFDPEITSHGFLDGMTALHWAAWNGNLEMMEVLLKHNANIEALNAWGGSVMYSTVYADREGNPAVDHIPAILRLLQAGARVKIGLDGKPEPTGVQRIDELLQSWVAGPTGIR